MHYHNVRYIPVEFYGNGKKIVVYVAAILNYKLTHNYTSLKCANEIG